MASRRWRSPARNNRQIFANDYGSGLLLLLLPPILALLCGPADQLFADGRPQHQQQQHRHGNDGNRANAADCGDNSIGIKAMAGNSLKTAKFGRQFNLEDPKQLEEVLKQLPQNFAGEQMKGAFLEDYSGTKQPPASTSATETTVTTPTTETEPPATTLGLTCAHHLELFVYPHGLYCKEISDDPDVPECVPIDPNGKCYTAAICYPSSRANANLKNGSSWLTEYCELHKPSAAAIHSDEGNNYVWHGIGARICASQEADDIVVNLEMASTFSAEISRNFDKPKARFSTLPSGDMAPYLDVHPLIALDCNIDGVSSQGLCKATLYNGRNRNRTDVGNKFPATITNDLPIALCEIGNLSPQQMYFTENVGYSSKCDGVIYWMMNGTKMRSKTCTFNKPKPRLEDHFTKDEYQAYKQWIKEDREIMCKCLDKLQPPPPPGLVLPPVKQLNNKTRKNNFCVLAEKNVTDQDMIAAMPLPSLDEARKYLERKRKKCGLESNLNNTAAKWTWKSVPRGDGWKWDYKKFPIKYSHADIDDEKEKLFRNTLKKGIRLISDQTCVSFAFSPLVDENEPHLYYFEGHWCFTRDLGKSAGPITEVSIAEGCRRIGTVAHETMHALGFAHEQNRSDRDDYVWVNFEETGNPFQYELMKSDNLNLGYDFGSVMHYPDSGSAMVALVRAYQRTMGQRSAVSFKDAKGINTVYCNHICKRQRIERGGDICQNGGYLDPKNCERCKCPDGYGGDICQDVATSDSICGDLDNELVAGEKDKVYEFKFESKGIGRCYVRVWPKMPMNRVWITIMGMEGFKCNDDSYVDINDDSYVEIKYKVDKTVAGPRIRCMEKDVPQKDYKFDTDNHTEIVLIFDMHASGLTVNFQYGAGGDVLGELSESCGCDHPSYLFIPERNPGMSVEAFYEKRQCWSRSWPSIYAELQCNPWKGAYTLVNGKYRTHTKEDIYPGWNTSDVRPKESAVWMNCKAIANNHNQSVWIYEDDKYGLVRVDEFMCIHPNA